VMRLKFEERSLAPMRQPARFEATRIPKSAGNSPALLPVTV
jgi:hypothetical protein